MAKAKARGFTKGVKPKLKTARLIVSKISSQFVNQNSGGKSNVVKENHTNHRVSMCC